MNNFTASTRSRFRATRLTRVLIVLAAFLICSGLAAQEEGTQTITEIGSDGFLIGVTANHEDSEGLFPFSPGKVISAETALSTGFVRSDLILLEIQFVGRHRGINLLSEPMAKACVDTHRCWVYVDMVPKRFMLRSEESNIAAEVDAVVVGARVTAKVIRETGNTVIRAAGPLVEGIGASGDTRLGSISEQ